LNAFIQTLLPCSPLMQLFAQLSWHTLSKQRPAYACLVQIAFQFFGTGRTGGLVASEDSFQSTSAAPAAASLFGPCPVNAEVCQMTNSLAPFDPSLYAETLLRRFERQKAVSTPGAPGSGTAGALARFVHFVIGQLHDECKWPPISPIAGHYEDSPIVRIFGGVLHTGRGPQRTYLPDSGGLRDAERAIAEPFFVLHLDLTGEPCASVSEAVQQFLRPLAARFLRLPPVLLIHLQRFRTLEGLPTKVSRHCQLDMRLELEEAAHCMLRTVEYELCSAICHYGEVPEGGAYKALVRHHRADANAAGAHSGDEWYIFDDAAVRPKSGDELDAVVQCEGHHVCFLMYRREDTKTINLRPHAA